MSYFKRQKVDNLEETLKTNISVQTDGNENNNNNNNKRRFWEQVTPQ